MAVLVIIGLLSSAVILTLPDGRAEIEVVSQDFHRGVNQAAQTSLLSGKVTALGLSQNAYGFYQYRDNAWVTETTYNWPEGTQITFVKDKVLIKLTDTILPLAVFEPTGQATVFSLKLADADYNYHFVSTGDGRVTRVDTP